LDGFFISSYLLINKKLNNVTPSVTVPISRVGRRLEEYSTEWLGATARSCACRECGRSHVPDGNNMPNGRRSSVTAILYPYLFVNGCQFDEETRKKAEFMALIHDLGEALTGDITPFDGISRGK
jgi:HD domain